MSDDHPNLVNRVTTLEKEQIRMSMEQERTNEILTEFRDDVKSAFKWLFSLMATAFGAALLSLVLKHPII
jgi:hypothetical protein